MFKGVKISLAASGLIIGSCVFADTIISTDTTTQLNENNLNITITKDGSITNNTGNAILLNADLNAGQSIINNGTLNSSSTTAGLAIAGIRSGNNNSGTIINNGNINTTAVYEADGIYIGGLNSGTIINKGNITLKSQGIFINGIIIQSTGINTGTIENSSGASILIDGNSNGYGISMRGTNGGTITNNGDITINSSTESIGLEIGTGSNDNTGTLNNSGAINVTATAGESFGMKLFKNNTGDINNSGTINATGSTAAYGIYTVGNNSANINNSGTIRADINGNLDAAAYSIKEATIHTASGTITNSSTGKLYGNISTGDTLNNYGKVELPWNANNTNKAAIENFTNKTNGILSIGLKSGSDGITTNKYSQLEVTDATLESGSTIHVNVIEAGTLIDGKTLDNILVASNSLTAPTDLSVTDNSAMLSFSYVKNGQSIGLDVEVGSYQTTAQNGGANKTAVQIGKVLDTVSDNQNSSMFPLLGDINKLPTAKSVANAINSLAPHISSGINSASNQVINNIQSIVDMRQSNTLNSGLNSGDNMLNEKNVWVKQSGSSAKQDDVDGLNGFTLDTHNMAIGFDTKNKKDVQTGLAFFYTNADVSVNHLTQTSDLNVFTLLGYGSIPLQNNMNFMYQGSYSWQKTETSRTIFNGDIAKSDFTANTLSINLKLAKDYEFNKNFTVRPIVAATYNNYKTPSYKEHGASGANLEIEKNTFEKYLVSLGSMFEYKLNNDSKIIGNANVEYDLKGDIQTSTANFVEASGEKFSSVGRDNGQWKYKVGIGYEKDLINNQSVNILFEHEKEGSSFKNNTISMKYVIKF